MSPSRSSLLALGCVLLVLGLQCVKASPFQAGPSKDRAASSASSAVVARCQSQQDFDLSGVWLKHDRAVVERFHM